MKCPYCGNKLSFFGKELNSWGVKKCSACGGRFRVTFKKKSNRKTIITACVIIISMLLFSTNMKAGWIVGVIMVLIAGYLSAETERVE